MSSNQDTTFESLRVTPGNQAIYNPSVYGTFVILVVDSLNPITNDSEKRGLVVPYSYIQKTAAEVGSKSIRFEELETSGLSAITIPEAWSDNTLDTIFKKQVYLAISILTENTAIAYIEQLARWFYVPYHTYLALIAWDALGAVKGNLNHIIRSLKDQLRELHRLWENDTKEYIVPEYKNIITGHNIQELKEIDIPYFLRPIGIFIQKNVDIVTECYLLSKSNYLGVLIASSPNYCTLVHDPLYLEFFRFALQCLCDREAHIIISKNRTQLILDTCFFDLEYLSQEKTLVTENTYRDKSQYIEKFLTPITESLELLDYYAGFPVAELNLIDAYVTGDVIPACFHGTTYGFTNRRPYGGIHPGPVEYKNKDKINILYPEFYAVVTPPIRAISNSELKVISLDEFLPTTTLDINDGFTANLVVEQNNQQTQHSISLGYGSKLKIYILHGELLEQRAQEFYTTILQYYPQAILQEYETPKNRYLKYMIFGAHRVIKITQGDTIRILKSVFSMTRGYVTRDSEDSETLSVILSSTCILSAFSVKSYNYYARGLGRPSDIRRRNTFFCKGYGVIAQDKLYNSVVNIALRYDNRKLNDPKTSPFGVENASGFDTDISRTNILYRTTTNGVSNAEFMKLAIPWAYYSGNIKE